MPAFLENMAHKYTGKVAGVDLFIQDERIVLNYVVLKKVKNSLEIIDKGEGLDSVLTLKEKIGTSIPVIVSINSRLIIQKKLANNNSNDSELQIVKQAIPGIGVDNIYYQIIEDKKYLNVSCVRKSTLDEILSEFKSKKILVSEIFLGPNSTSQIIDIVSNQEVITHEYSFNIGHVAETWKEVKATDISNHEVSGENLTGNLLSAYSNAVTWFTQSFDAKTNYAERISQLREEYTYLFWFQRTGLSLLALLFIVLLINYIVYSGRSNKIAEVNSIIHGNKATLENIEVLSNEIAKKEIYVRENNILKGTRHSFYADRIAVRVPSDMRLDRIHVYPPASDLQQNQKIEYLDVIYISGAGSTESLEEFSINLKQEEWIKNIDVVDLKAANQYGKIKFLIQVKF